MTTNAEQLLSDEIIEPLPELLQKKIRNALAQDEDERLEALMDITLLNDNKSRSTGLFYKSIDHITMNGDASQSATIMANLVTIANQQKDIVLPSKIFSVYPFKSAMKTLAEYGQAKQAAHTITMLTNSFVNAGNSEHSFWVSSEIFFRDTIFHRLMELLIKQDQNQQVGKIMANLIKAMAPPNDRELLEEELDKADRPDKHHNFNNTIRLLMYDPDHSRMSKTRQALNRALHTIGYRITFFTPSHSIRFVRTGEVRRLLTNTPQ